MDRKLLEVVATNGDIVTSINCDFREMFSILVHLVTQVSLSTGGEISYNEVLDDLKLVEKDETNERKH
ncbi:hypothetical protein CRP143_gp16 [Roseobacter phage CRP-143]|nr:hypothetical protein CRP143_gp16 [Roseobacter phage CRP-143]